MPLTRKIEHDELCVATFVQFQRSRVIQFQSIASRERYAISRDCPARHMDIDAATIVQLQRCAFRAIEESREDAGGLIDASRNGIPAVRREGYALDLVGVSLQLFDFTNRAGWNIRRRHPDGAFEPGSW